MIFFFPKQARRKQKKKNRSGDGRTGGREEPAKRIFGKHTGADTPGSQLLGSTERGDDNKTLAHVKCSSQVMETEKLLRPR